MPETEGGRNLAGQIRADGKLHDRGFSEGVPASA